MKEKLIQLASIFICLSSFTAQSTAGEMHRELSSSRNNSREVKNKESKEPKSRENFSDKTICKYVNEVAKADKRIDENLGWAATKLDKQSSNVLQEAFCAIFYGENKEPREKRTGSTNKFNQIELPSKASVPPTRFKVVENNKSMLQSLREISASRENESAKAPAYFPPPPPPNYVPDGKENLDEAPPLPIGK